MKGFNLSSLLKPSLVSVYWTYFMDENKIKKKKNLDKIQLIFQLVFFCY